MVEGGEDSNSSRLTAPQLTITSTLACDAMSRTQATDAAHSSHTVLLTTLLRKNCGGEEGG